MELCSMLELGIKDWLAISTVKFRTITSFSSEEIFRECIVQ